MSIFSAIKNAIFGAPAQAAPAAAPVAAAPAAAAPVAATAEEIDARLAGIAAAKGAPSNYKSSIVDLMKLLDLDSSLANRTTLAHELGYTGDTNDSATMNIWLHGEVMKSLATRGA
jgi:hypothetical protein